MPVTVRINGVLVSTENYPTYRVMTDRNNAVSDANVAAGHYYIPCGVTPVALTGSGSGTRSASSFYIDPTELSVLGKTTVLNLSVSVVTNSVAAALTLTYGLYPVTAGGGAIDVASITLGTVVTGSTAAMASPAANSLLRVTSGDFAVPSAGHYALGVQLSAAMTLDAFHSITARLRVKNV